MVGDFLRLFFTVNEVIVHFVHGQVFFLLAAMMGVLWMLQRSRLNLTRALPWLAAFGLLEAVATWGNVFIPIQEQLLPAEIVQHLRFAQLVIYLLNFATLLGFGLRLLEPRMPTWAAVYVPLVIVLITVTALLTARAVEAALLINIESSVEAMLRYGLGLPAALLVAQGLYGGARQLIKPLQETPHLVRSLRAAGLSFVFYAVVEGLIVPAAPFAPAMWLNEQTVFAMLDVPIGVFRSIGGALIMWFLFRSLDAFRIEADRRDEEVQRQYFLQAERERISRDLHDGILQSLYGTGLVLEQVRHALAEALAERHNNGLIEQARQDVESALQMLNRTNNDIRRYVYDLRQASPEATNLSQVLLGIVTDFRLRTGIQVEWKAEGVPSHLLTVDQRSHICQIAREALSNIARHAEASKAEVTLCYCAGAEDTPPYMEMTIRDNGKGFAAVQAQASHGLLNMRERAEMLNGRLDIRSTPGKGTAITLRVPLG